MKHFIGVTIVVAILTAIVGLGLTEIDLMPAQASVQAQFIDALFAKHIWAFSFLFALIIGFMLYSMVVFRRKPGDDSDGDHFEGHTGLEIAWTVIPLIFVFYFAFLGSTALAEVLRADPNAYNIAVVGSQWSWRFDYTDYGFSSDELRLPIDRQTLLLLSSTDVIHSFWVPEFRVKQDALPGENMERELRVTPTDIGKYTVMCAEICGQQHAYMTSNVIVMEVGAFEEWVEEMTEGPSDDPVIRGEEVVQQFGCIACHSIDGSDRVGPSWKGLIGKEETMADGSTVLVDEAYLLESILDPQAKIVTGYENIIMPPTGIGMTEEQVSDVIAFIESLRE